MTSLSFTFQASENVILCPPAGLPNYNIWGDKDPGICFEKAITGDSDTLTWRLSALLGLLAQVSNKMCFISGPQTEKFSGPPADGKRQYKGKVLHHTLPEPLTRSLGLQNKDIQPKAPLGLHVPRTTDREKDTIVT